MSWTLILVLAFTAFAACIVYLIKKYSFLFEKTKGIGKYFISAAVLSVLIGLLTLAWSIINALICVIHLALFRLMMSLFKKKSQAFKGLSALVITVVYLLAGWYCAHNVWVTTYSLETSKATGDIRIIQFADSHIGATFHADGFLKQIERMNEYESDVVLLTGDFVDDGTTKEDMLASCEALSHLKTKYGVYFSFGNHDKGYYAESRRGYGVNDLVQALAENGVIVLEDEIAIIDERAAIIGRADYSKRNREEIDKLMTQVPNDMYTIVMDHQPHDYEAEAKAGADLVLSGHTHGGQMIPINRVGYWIGENDRTYGIETRQNTDFIVTSGISCWEIKFKTGCISEFVIIDIKGEQVQ